MADSGWTDKEFQAEYECSLAAGRLRRLVGPHAIAARYDRRKRLMVVELNTGVVIAFPPGIAQGLEGAAPLQLEQVEVSPAGVGLHWPVLDVDLSVAGIAAGIFGSQTWMRELARRGGSSASLRKIAAARENGKKGGRPRRRVA